MMPGVTLCSFSPTTAPLQAELEEIGAVRPAGSKPPGPGSKPGKPGRGGRSPPASRPRRFSAPSGLHVLVGRTSTQNDALSTRLARDWDVWMHARGVPGAHVLLRLDRGQTPDEADLQAAADLAAWFSKARGATAVDVTVARGRDVLKPKGAARGQVMLRQEERVIAGRPDAGRRVAEEEQAEA